MQLLVLAVAWLALPWQASARNLVQETLRLSTPRVRKGAAAASKETRVITSEQIKGSQRRRRSLQITTQSSSGTQRRADSRDEPGEDSKDDKENDREGRARTWGQASGQQVSGYHASGYHNGYTAGTYNASLVNFQKGGPTGDHTYLGCLGLSNYELEHEWKFSGTPPSCSYVHHSKKKKRKKGKTAAASDMANTTCSKSGWFSSCKAATTTGQKNHTSSWANYYNNMASHFSSTGRTTNATNTTNSTYQSAGAGEEGGPDEQEEGEQGPDEEEEAGREEGDEERPDDEDDDDEGDSQDNEPDDDTVVTNEVYENVNGEDFVYEQSNVGTANGKTSWWSQWGHKINNSTSNNTAGNTQNYAAQAEAASSGDGMEGEAAIEEEQAEEEPEGEGDENEYDPYDDFDLEQCDTYQNLWLWDLSLTCKSAKSMDACECSYAEELLYEGTISCEDFSLCPADCAVCRTCFQLMGCVKSHHETSSLSPGGLAGVFVGALAFVLVGGAVYYLMRRRRKLSNGDLGVHLMWRELGSKAESDTESNDSGAWVVSRPTPSSAQHQSTDNSSLFDDYYRSMDEGDAHRPQQALANPGRPAIQLNSQGETDTLVDSIGQDGGTVGDAGTASIVDGDSSSTDDSDESSATSDYDSTVDGSTVLSGDETGSPKIWLAPVDVKLDQQEEGTLQ